jgi:hypothetical protein
VHTPQIISLDPYEMEIRFSEDDSLRMKSASWAELEGVDITPLMSKLPDLEADFVHLYFNINKKQSDIAKIFRCTQAAVSYRLKKAVRRIQFLIELENISEEKMREDLGKIMSSLDVDILLGMYKTTCQSWVAEQLGLSQGLVRHRFFKSLHTLKKKSEYKDPYFFIFDTISKNFNILKEVILPQWNHYKGNIVMPVERV